MSQIIQLCTGHPKCRYCSPDPRNTGMCANCWEVYHRWRVLARQVSNYKLSMRPAGPVFVYKVDLVEEKAMAKLKEKLKRLNKV